jgi:hypothetical protein
LKTGFIYDVGFVIAVRRKAVTDLQVQAFEIPLFSPRPQQFFVHYNTIEKEFEKSLIQKKKWLRSNFFTGIF